MIEHRFSAAAQTYDRHARPQQLLAQTVVDSIPKRPTTILELGVGTGQLTRLLCAKFPEARIDAVDISAKMIEHSRAQFNNPAINWIVGDAQTYQPNKKYSLIVSSSALHWVENLQTTFKNIFQCLEPGGFFAFGLMLDGTLQELHQLRKEIAPQNLPNHTLPSYESVVNALLHTGFVIKKQNQFSEKMVYSSAKDFFKALHEQGVTGGKFGAAKRPLSRTELAQLVDQYQQRFSTAENVFATYQTASFLVSN